MKVDRRAVVAGAVRAAAIAAVAIVAAQLVKSLTGADANLFLYLLLLGGLVIGGRAAASRQPDAPLTHGALASLCAYVALIIVIAIIRLALGREQSDPISLIFNGLMAASAGIFGGYLAVRRPAPTTE